MNAFQKVIAFFGRICLSLVFISAGVSAVFNWPGSEQSVSQALSSLQAVGTGGTWMHSLAEKAIPLTSVLTTVGICVEILGGLLVLTGIQMRFGAFLLLLFLLPTTALFHPFWVLQEPERSLQTIMFLKNLSIFGGLLLLLAFGKGPGSSKLREKPAEKKS